MVIHFIHKLFEYYQIFISSADQGGLDEGLRKMERIVIGSICFDEGAIYATHTIYYTYIALPSPLLEHKAAVRFLAMFESSS